MQTNISRAIDKLRSGFEQLNQLPKGIIKYGMQIFLALFALGTLFIVFNHSLLGYDSYRDFIAKTFIKNTFTVLAEIVIGALVIDYVFKRK